MSTTQLQQDVYANLIVELEQSGSSAAELSNRLASLGNVSDDQAPIAIEAAWKLSGGADFALRLGQRIGIESYGTFGFALMSCANLRASIELLTRYGQLFFKPGWQSHVTDKGLVLRLQLTRGTKTQQQIITELCFSQLSTIGASLYGRKLEGAEAHFQHPKPAHAKSYRVLNARVHFDADQNELFLPLALLDTPVKTANVSDHVVFQQQCEMMLESLGSAEKTTTSVRQWLIKSAGDFLDINQVADRLHVSERTLRRRLESESTSFRAVFDEVRDLLAKEYLAKTSLTVAEVAFLLDYSETVNFRRAFVRWNGVTPNDYRQLRVKTQ